MISTPAGFSLARDSWGHLVLTTADGSTHVGVDPARAFPLSDPRRAVSILDAHGRELLFLDRLDDVPEPTRRILEDELAQRHFLPVIRRILGIVGHSEPVEVSVETDRGPATFSIKAEEDVRRLPPHRVLISDAHGVRYLIPDTTALDAASRRWLERYV